MADKFLRRSRLQATGDVPRVAFCCCGWHVAAPTLKAINREWERHLHLASPNQDHAVHIEDQR